MRNHSRVVIIGAGIVGCSVAYHLARLGWTNIIVLDQGPLFKTGGSTSHAPGMVFQANFSKILSEFAKYTAELYGSLDLEGTPCYAAVGGMEIAWTKERWQDLKRKTATAKLWGIETDLITQEEAREMIPLISKDIFGAMYSLKDGVTEQIKAAEAMANYAKSLGVEFRGMTEVTGIGVSKGRVTSVSTNEYEITTEHLVIAAGIWGPLIGQMADLSIPLQPMRHQFAHTQSLPELLGVTEKFRDPILRHQDDAMYMRQRADHYVIGCYRHEPMLVEPSKILNFKTARVMPSMMDWNDAMFQFARESVTKILPCLNAVSLDYKVNGMFSFTSDGMPLLGESPELKGAWLAEAVWITHAGGVGKAIAEWMVEGTPQSDLRDCDISRFHKYATAKPYIGERAAQQYREVYDIIHPLEQMKSPREIRVSPFYTKQKNMEAVFFESAGWERPQWYDINKSLLSYEDDQYPNRSGWEALNWSRVIFAEHRSTRKRAGLFDLTPFTKLEISGEGALEFLQHMCANDINRPIGTIIYTSMLNNRGGVQCDLTVTRLDTQQFFVVTSSVFGLHDRLWMERHCPNDDSVSISDLTSNYSCIGLWGPHARKILQNTTEHDISNKTFPYMTAQTIEIGSIPVLALRISYVGELGWELYTDMEIGQKIWDIIWEAGLPYKLAPVGNGAFDSLRLEKGYRLWGSDIHTEYNPIEAGIEFAVDLSKPDFLGKDALLKAPIERKLTCIKLDNQSSTLMGLEPVFDRGTPVGYVTSTSYCPTIDESIAYAYLPIQIRAEGKKVEIEYFGEMYPATISSEPRFDPRNLRLRQ